MTLEEGVRKKKKNHMTLEEGVRKKKKTT